MSTLIVYMTKHGTTEKAVNLLKDKIEDELEIVNLKKNSNPRIDFYDTIIIGGSIHAGNIQRKLKKFVIINMELLLKKRLGLFICCMEEGEKAQSELHDSFSRELRNHAVALGLFGGEFNIEKMNFFEKKIVKSVANISESISKFDIDSLERFANKINFN